MKEKMSNVEIEKKLINYYTKEDYLGNENRDRRVACAFGMLDYLVKEEGVTYKQVFEILYKVFFNEI